MLFRDVCPQVFVVFSLCGDFWKTTVWYKQSKTCVSCCEQWKTPTTRVKLSVNAVSRSYWMLCHSSRNIGCALMCLFISLSTVITTDAFLYQLSSSARSHRKRGCLTAVLMSLRVCLSVMSAPITRYNTGLSHRSDGALEERQDGALTYDFYAPLVCSSKPFIHKSRRKNWFLDWHPCLTLNTTAPTAFT